MDDDHYEDDYVEEPRPRYNQDAYAPRRKEREREPLSIQSSSYSDFSNVQITIHEPITYDDAPKVLNDVKQQKIVLLNFEMLEMDKKNKSLSSLQAASIPWRHRSKRSLKIFLSSPRRVFM